MDTKVNFSKIGFFVIILFILLLAFIFWLGKYGFEKKRYDYYTVYFTESVSGLNLESPIKYKGFEVGSVKNIKINPKNSEQIEITIAIDEGIPIKEDNFATLGTLGITGLKYIELKGGSHNSALLHANENNKKIIQSKQSVIESLELSTKDFKDILIQTKKLLSDENLQDLSNLIKHSSNSFKNLDTFTQHLIAKEKTFDALLEEFSRFANTSSDSFKIMSDSASTVKESAAAFELLSQALLQEVQNGSLNIKEISQESLDRLNEVLKSLDSTLLQTQNFIQELEKSPSDIVFKQQAIQYGPGE
ncbi:MAG: MlaD family protein [Arcobacteraceae bacterium]|jgi:phospholipid/cholesterol/gamma-HCH transport system substrate-binding protein|nr:MlaD family protein [Arcobacteraceae bacterium]